MAEEIAHIVLVDSGLEVKLPLVVKKHVRRLQLNDIALLSGEVENG